MHIYNPITRYVVLIVVLLVSLSTAGCTPGAVTAPTRLPANPAINTAPPTVTTMPGTAIDAPVLVSAASISRPVSPIATLTPSPEISLNPSESYFTVDGKQSFLFSRNITGAYNTDFSDFEKFLTYAQAAGDRVVRLQIDNLGLGFNSAGAVDENWAQKWEHIFDLASAKGLAIIPEFGVWLWWSNDGLWKDNPLNTVKGGPATTPGELFKRDSDTQQRWLRFVQKLVERWQPRQSIIAWEIFSEINLASGSSDQNALDFVEPAAATIRGADPHKRPVTVSVADVVSVWSSVNQSQAIDFLEVHPYPVDGKLDRAIVDLVGQRIRDFHRPVLIGESGLTGLSPDPFTRQPRAHYGIEHALWADLVSGAMNGRALWDQDSYAIYWTGATDAEKQKFIEDYARTEVPVVNFVKGLDFAGFLPLNVSFAPATNVWGAAVGNERMIIGWFRDAQCEPPDWNLQPTLSKQAVAIVVSGPASHWKVDFYDTRTGTKIIGSATVTRVNNRVIIPLPDFTDDIAFKLYPQLE